jgi:hypothetical protein
VKRLPEGGFGGVVDGGIAGSFGSVSFGGPNACRMPNGVPILRPGMEVAMGNGTTTTATGSQAEGIGRSRSVNEGRINNNANNDTTSLRAPTPRLLNLAAIDRPQSHPTAAGPGQEFSRTIHETIGNLRQTYINSLHVNEFETEFRTDGEAVTNVKHSILASRVHPSTASTPPPLPPPPRPTTPLHRSISNPSASPQASARNFSLPSYGSPSAKEENQQKQQQSALGSRSISGPLHPQQQQQQQFALESRSMSGPLPLPSSFHRSPSASKQQQQEPFELEARSISGPLPLPSMSSRWDLRVDNAAAMTATPTTPVQNTPRRPLRRMRSRSVDLGRIAEAREVPRMPTRRLGWWDEIEEEAAEVVGADDGKGEEEGAGHDPDIEEPETTKATKAGKPTATKPTRKVWKEVAVVEDELVEEAQKEEEEEEEEACGRCKSIRRALARNPLCCVDRTRFHRLCFKCWSEALAEGLKSEEREKWLCCVVCGRELLLGDAKRLASWGTILR